MNLKKCISVFVFVTLITEARAAEAKSQLTMSKVNRSQFSEDIQDNSIYVIGSQDEAFLTPGSAQFLSKEKVKKFDYSDPIRLLQAVPGVYLQEEDGYGLRPNVGLRGATPHRSKKITLMEDGILITPAPYSAPAAYFFPNMMKTNNMEVFKGVLSVKYGPNSIGGAINFVTNPIPKKTRSEIAASYGDIKRYEVSTGGRVGRVGYLLEYNRMESEGFKKLPSGEETGFEKDDFMLKGEYKLGRYKQKISVKTSYSRENSHETYLGLTEQDFKKSGYKRYAASSNDLMNWEHQQYQLRHSISPNQSVKIDTALYYHKFDRNWSKLSGFNNGVHVSNYLTPSSALFDPHFLRVIQGEEDSTLASGEDELVIGNNNRKYYSGGVVLKSSFLFQHSAGIYHNVSLGLRYHQDQIKRLHTKDNFKMINRNLIPSTQGELGTQNIDTAYAKTIFLEDEVDFSNGFVVSAGIRLEEVDTKREFLKTQSQAIKNRYQVVAPGMGVQYSPIKELNFIAGVNKGISTISPGQAIDIEPEESINYEAGLKYKGVFRGELIGFLSDYKSIKGFCSFSSGCQEQGLDQEFNGGKAKVYGFESHIGKEFKASSFVFPIDLSYTKTIAQFLDSAQSNNREWGLGLIRKGDPLPYIPEDKLSLSIGAKYKKVSSFFIYNWQSFIYDQAVQEGRKTIDAYGVFDWMGKYKYSKSGEVFVKIDNLLAKEYIVSLRPFGARPGKPQSFSLGLKHVF